MQDTFYDVFYFRVLKLCTLHAMRIQCSMPKFKQKTLNNKCNVKMCSLGLDIHIRQEFTPDMGALSVLHKFFTVGRSSTEQCDMRCNIECEQIMHRSEDSVSWSTSSATALSSYHQTTATGDHTLAHA